MEIIETPTFTRRVIEILSDDEYRQLQTVLISFPDAGKVMPGSGGLRKIRWDASGRGKRGGARIIYYVVTTRERILMLFIFVKSEMETLTPHQVKLLRQIVEKEIL